MGQTVGGILLAAAIIGALAVIGKALWWFAEVMRKFSRLVDDLTGEPARPGFPEGRPGVLDRLTSIEAAAGKVEERLAAVEAQMKPNGGGSLRDAVDKLAPPTQELAA